MFVDLRNIGDNIIALINPNDALVLVAGFKAVVSAWFIGYLLYVGYMTMAGRTRTPLSDIMIKVVVFTAISAFAFNIGGWYNLAINAINGLNTWASSGSTDSIYLKLDLGLWEIDKLHEVFIKNDDTWGYPLIASLGATIVYISYYVFAVYITALLVINSLTLKLIVFIFPVAVMTLFFPMVKGVFERWLEIAISNILTILFISIFFNAIWSATYQKMMDIIASAKDLEILTVAFSLAGLYAMGFFLIKVSVAFAEKLTRVSAEYLPGAVAKSSAIGATTVAYIVTNAIKNVVTKSANDAKAKEEENKKSSFSSPRSTSGGNSTNSSASSLNKNSNSKNQSSRKWAKVGSINKYKKAKDNE